MKSKLNSRMRFAVCAKLFAFLVRTNTRRNKNTNHIKIGRNLMWYAFEPKKEKPITSVLHVSPYNRGCTSSIQLNLRILCQFSSTKISHTIVNIDLCFRGPMPPTLRYLNDIPRNISKLFALWIWWRLVFLFSFISRHVLADVKCVCEDRTHVYGF